MYKDITIAGVLNLFSWTLARSLVVAEWWSSVSYARCWSTNSVIVLGIKSCSNSTLVHLISWILNRIWWLINYILLELCAVLVFHWNRLHWLLLILIHIVELIWIYLDVLMVWILLNLSRWTYLSSYSWTSTLIFWLIWTFGISTHWNSIASSWNSVFFFHLIIQGFSIIKYLH